MEIRRIERQHLTLLIILLTLYAILFY
jgi:hypothetical protein